MLKAKAAHQVRQHHLGLSYKDTHILSRKLKRSILRGTEAAAIMAIIMGICALDSSIKMAGFLMACGGAWMAWMAFCNRETL